MFQHSRLSRLIAVGLATAAFAPASALAVPAIDGGVGAPASGQTQDLRAPDQVVGPQVGRQVVPRAETYPVSPHPTQVGTQSNNDGIAPGLLIAGGAAAFAVAGFGVAYRRRPRAGQPA